MGPALTLAITTPPNRVIISADRCTHIRAILLMGFRCPTSVIDPKDQHDQGCGRDTTRDPNHLSFQDADRRGSPHAQRTPNSPFCGRGGPKLLDVLQFSRTLQEYFRPRPVADKSHILRNIGQIAAFGDVAAKQEL
jgi:hypothetical protein